MVELLDADSVGLNALLSRLSSEVKIDILLTTEKNPQTRGCIHEVALASKMMFLAKKRDSMPCDLGLDLLVLKDKVDRELTYDIGKAKVIKGKKPNSIQVRMDPCGVFKIAVDREHAVIVALHYRSTEEREPTCAISGAKVEAVLAEIFRRKLVSSLDHAAYLGEELSKAEVALRVGLNYLQDTPLFGK